MPSLNRMIQTESKALVEIRKHAVLIYLDFRKYEGRIKMHGAQLIIEDKEVDDDEIVTKSNWKLIPNDWLSGLRKVEYRAKNCLRRNGSRIRNSVYLIPNTVFNQVVEELEDVKIQHHQVAAENVRLWPTVLEEIKRKVVDKTSEKAWEEIAPRLLTQEKLLERYRMEFGFWPIGGDMLSIGSVLEECISELSQIANGSEQLLSIQAKLARVLEENGDRIGKIQSRDVADRIQMLRASTNKMLQERLEAAFEEPRRELSAAIVELIKRINENSQLRNTSLGRVERAMQKLLNFRWMCTDELANQLNNASRQITEFRESASVPSYTGEISDILKGVMKVLNSPETGNRYCDI